MALLTLQKSTDGKTWVPDGSFRSKEEARAFFKTLEGPGMDWRVGFLLRTREGVFYRLVHKDGREVRP